MVMSSKTRIAGRIARNSLTILAGLLLISSGILVAAKAIVAEPQSAPGPDQSSKPANESAFYGPVYKIGNGVTAPAVLHFVDAEFPKSGKSLPKEFQAIVRVGCIVDPQGMPRNVHITRSYNSEFDAQAIKAIKQYTFKPALHAGQPVAVAINVEVNFKKN